MNKKIKKTTLLIIFMFFSLIIFLSNNVKAKGLVYQGWYSGGELHFITLTAPHSSTVKKYVMSENFKEPKGLVDIGAGTKFTYNGNKYDAKWYMFSDNKQVLTGDPGTAGVFSTYRLSFHTNMMANYGNSNCSDKNSQSCYRYASLTGVFSSQDISNLKSHYEGLSTLTTSYSTIGNNSNYNEVLGIKETSSTSSLYKMAIVNRGNGYPAYLAERRITSSNVNTLKKSGKLQELAGFKNSIFVSQMLHVGVMSGGFKIENADNPQAFMKFGVDKRIEWLGGTRGWNDTEKLGSVLNLFDNILVFPSEANRKVVIKHINIGENDTIDTATVNAGAGKQISQTISVSETPTYKKIDTYGIYMGYNVGIADTADNAKEKVKTNVDSSAMNGTAESYTVNANAASDAQYIYIEMYYMDKEETPSPPPEEKEPINIIIRDIYYYDDGEIKEVKEREPIIAKKNNQQYDILKFDEVTKKYEILRTEDEITESGNRGCIGSNLKKDNSDIPTKDDLKNGKTEQSLLQGERYTR